MNKITHTKKNNRAIASKSAKL